MPLEQQHAVPAGAADQPAGHAALSERAAPDRAGSFPADHGIPRHHRPVSSDKLPASQPDTTAASLPPARAWENTDLECEKTIIVRHVFHRHGEQIREFPYHLWHGACAAAKIPGKRIPHDFRGTAARSYRRAGVSEGVVMKILGHKTHGASSSATISRTKTIFAKQLGPAQTKWHVVGHVEQR